MQALADGAADLSNAEFAAFFQGDRADPGNGDGWFAASAAAPPDLERLRLPLIQALSAGPMTAGELRCDDILVDEHRSSVHQRLRLAEFPVRSYAVLPLGQHGDGLAGALLVGHSRPAAFGVRDQRRLSMFASHVGLSLENLRCQAALAHALEEGQRFVEQARDARAEMERVSQLNDEFLATLSHELRTPLSSILGWAQVLRRNPHEDSDRTRGLEAIERNARAQTYLIEELLDMSRIASGKVRLDMRPIQPVSFIEEALETVSAAASAKHVTLERSLDPMAGPVQGDPSRLQQVAWNVLSNAVKFTPRGGTVRVDLRRLESTVEFSVTDTGIGISHAFQPHLFERFRQADASTTREFGGLGLGLPIVKHLVEMHGGTISVISRGEGLGTTVIVRLPVAALRTSLAISQAFGDRRRPPVTTPANLAGIRVLVVDDQRDTREVIKRMLEDYAAEVVTAESADEALMLLDQQKPDILISDIGMPGADGFELLRRVRVLTPERGGRVPAIALTALTRPIDRNRVLQAGFLVHVAKPVEPAELVATVATVARRKTPTVSPVSPA